MKIKVFDEALTVYSIILRKMKAEKEIYNLGEEMNL